MSVVCILYRYQDSALNHMNEDQEKQKKDLSKLLQVNNGIVNSTPIT